MDLSQHECPQCGYDYLEFYEAPNYVRYTCPDCGYTEVVEKKEEKNKD
jgi:predicted RNA-binding Zn-ribbon protein involved in translation (DUF1610 family)